MVRGWPMATGERWSRGPELRYWLSGLKLGSKPAPAGWSCRPVLKRALTAPWKASSRYSNPPTEAAMSLPSLLRMTWSKVFGVLASACTCSTTGMFRRR